MHDLRYFQIIYEDMEWPSTRRMELQSTLTTCSCPTTNHLFLIRCIHRRFENMNIFDVEQINALFEATVHDDETSLFAVNIFGALIELFQNQFFVGHVDRLTKHGHGRQQEKTPIFIGLYRFVVI